MDILNTNTVELLAPVGDFDCLKAAVQNGADCIYLGAEMFSARASATNFNLDELQQAIQYAKIRNVKTNLTLNTLIKDNEFDSAIEVAIFAYQNGIDAIIVQDLGLAKFLIRNFPNLPVHASTQMTIHNLEGALQAQQLGFSRAVLAREVPLDEFTRICSNSSIEIETFIHGALCISYSGQCLLSSMIGGRSGNRGKCAQPCRLNYRLFNSDSNIDNGYLLSTRDLCGLTYIPDLINAGVKCFKIEGRMKPPEYVATVTKIYRKYIDLALSGNPYIIDEQDKKNLLQVFNRGGFSSGHLDSEPNLDLVYPKKPNNMGLPLGTVYDFNSSKGYITLKLDEPIKIGDTISLQNETGTYTISELMINGNNSPSAKVGDIVKIGRMKGDININDNIFKISNCDLIQSARDTFSNTDIKKIELDCSVVINKGIPISLTISGLKTNNNIYSELSVTSTSDTLPVEALNSPITRERIVSQISKTGNTPFIFKNISVNLGDNLFVPNISCLNELRRSCIAKLENLVIEKYCKRTVNSDLYFYEQLQKRNSNLKSTSILLNVLDDTINYNILKNINNVYIPLKFFICDKYFTTITNISTKFNVYIYMPIIFKYTDFNFDNILSKFNITGFVLSNISHFYILNKYIKNYEFIGNYCLNVFNINTVKNLIDLGLNTVTLSPELNKTDLCKLLSANNYCNNEIIVYGKIPVMNINYCLLSKSNKCYSNCGKECNIKDSTYYLKDRIGFEFQVIPDSISSVTTIYNSKTTSINLDSELLFNYRIDFINESIEDMQKIIDCATSGNRLEGKDFTNGNLNKEV